MKIHTTQNLDPVNTNQPINVMLSTGTRLKRSENIYNRLNSLAPKEDSVSFRGKKEDVVKLVKKIIEKAAGKEKLTDKILDSGFFDGILDMMSHEVFIQAAISFLICAFLRPLTIMSLPTKKSKEDNKYASAHSMSSGFVGLASSCLIAIPFSKGIKYAQKYCIQELDAKALAKRYPWLDLNSIWQDASKKVRKPVSEWLDEFGNVFSSDVKNAMKMAKPMHISQVSPKTVESVFELKLDTAKNAGKPISQWVDSEGRAIVDCLKESKLNNLCLAIQEEGMGGSIPKHENTNFFSLLHINDDLLKKVLPNLESSVDANGKKLPIGEWTWKQGVNVEDELINLIDSLHLSSYRETAESTPIYTGLKRVIEKGNKKIEKYVAYQDNVSKKNGGVPDKLGSPILQKALDADYITDIENKALGWFPDIISRPIVASSTIALLPMILKNVFHMEKPKKEAPAPAQMLATGKVVA